MSLVPTELPARAAARIRRMAPSEPAPVDQSLVLTGAKLLARRTALGLSRMQLAVLAVVGESLIRHAELDGNALDLGTQMRLEHVLRAIETAAAEARAAAGIMLPIVSVDKAG